MSNGSVSPSTPVIRLCQIIQWKNFDGYGFNLHAEKGKHGQYIGKVDEQSPAEAAGLKQGDRIIEVNGVNIANENHKQVVQRIKAIPDETRLLVVDSEADKYFKSNNIIIKSNLPHVVSLKTPPKPSTDSDNGLPRSISSNVEEEHRNSEDSHSNKSEKSSKSFDAEGNPYAEKLSYKSNTSNTTTPSSDRKHGSSPEPHLDSADETFPTMGLREEPPLNHGSNEALKHNDLNTNLNLNMTAKELRAKLASRKKYDPKKESMDFKKKFDIVQKL